jgi:hypothetical protein
VKNSRHFIAPLPPPQKKKKRKKKKKTEKKANLNYFHVEKTQEPTSKAKTHGTWGLRLKLQMQYWKNSSLI